MCAGGSETGKRQRRGRSEIANYVDPHRWSDGTKMAGTVRKVGPKDSRFCTFVPRFRFRLDLPLSPDYTDRRNGIGEERRDSPSRGERHLPFADLAREVHAGAGTSPASERAGTSVVAPRGRISSPLRFSPLRAFRVVVALSTRNGGFGCDSGNEKLENLVRLALKRLNVSYLTISSRLVWFERGALVRRARTWKEERTRRYSPRRTIVLLKFYSRADRPLPQTYRRYIYPFIPRLRKGRDI